MKRGAVSVLFITFVLLIGGVAFGQEDCQKQPTCKYCGMDRAKFAHSRMLVEYNDETVVGTCSIHCLAVDLGLNVGKTPRSLQVGDFNSKKLIDAEKAYWVIVRDKPGVMTKQAKWAFEKKEDAEKYIQENGGSLSTFDGAMKATSEGMYADKKMIREKNRKMRTQGMENK